MFPLRDSVPSGSKPFVNIAIIVIASLVFLTQLGSEDGGQRMIEGFGMIPARVQDPGETVYLTETEVVRTPFGLERRERERPAAPSAVHPWLTVLTCIFLHGGWLHFLGNIWFLWIFGDNVEDRLGHLKYLLFYLAAGALASLAHFMAIPDSPIPTIGASGAIAGVMGAYMVLYPRARVLTVIPIFFLIQMAVLPAPLFLGIWFAIQLFQGLLSIGTEAATGVAWWAHIGGFVVGAAFVLFARQAGILKPAVGRERDGMDHLRTYRHRF